MYISLFWSSISDGKEVGTTLDLWYHSYDPCLCTFLHSIPTSFSILCNCFLYFWKRTHICLLLVIAIYYVEILMVMCRAGWWMCSSKTQPVKRLPLKYDIVKTQPVKRLPLRHGTGLTLLPKNLLHVETMSIPYRDLELTLEAVLIFSAFFFIVLPIFGPYTLSWRHFTPQL